MRIMSLALFSCVAMALIACEPAPARAPAAGTTAAVFQAAERYVGTWTGATASGGAINIVVPASGTPSYSFRGSPVRVTSARMDGDRLMLRVGNAGGGTVTLTPAAGGQVQYDYRFGADTATALLTRS